MPKSKSKRKSTPPMTIEIHGKGIDISIKADDNSAIPDLITHLVKAKHEAKYESSPPPISNLPKDQLPQMVNFVLSLIVDASDEVVREMAPIFQMLVDTFAKRGVFFTISTPPQSSDSEASVS